LVALLVLLGIIGYLFLPAALFDRFDKVQSVQGTGRYVLTMIGLEMAVHNPIFGVGFGNFVYYFPKYDIFNRGGATAAHNLYTSIAAQTGFPSLVFYLLLMAVAWRRLGRLLARFTGEQNRFPFLLALALQANIVNLLVFGLTSHVEHEYLIFVVLAMTVILDRLARAAEMQAATASSDGGEVSAAGSAGEPS
jgi:O-antigen ligase